MNLCDICFYSHGRHILFTDLIAVCEGSVMSVANIYMRRRLFARPNVSPEMFLAGDGYGHVGDADGYGQVFRRSVMTLISGQAPKRKGMVPPRPSET